MSERSRRSQTDRSSLQHQAEHTRPPRRSALGHYLIILFAVAFLLLLLAYFQQQRQNSQATSDALKQSGSAVQTIQNLIDESNQLREENEALKAQVEELKETADSAQRSADAAQTVANSQTEAVEAMDYFWQIDEAYVRQRYTLCRQLIQELKEKGYEEALPSTKATDNDRFSPRDRYFEIYNALY